MSQFKETMQGVFTTSVSEHTLDEAPMAYKPMDAILDKIGDTVDVEGVISPLYNFKAAEA